MLINHAEISSNTEGNVLHTQPVMFEKLKVEKVELVKRVIRQNNYEQFEKTHRQCNELGLNINRQALERFANKLELIDKATLSKRQYELHKMELAAREQREKRDVAKPSKNAYQQAQQVEQQLKDMELEDHLDAMADEPFSESTSSKPAPSPVQKRPASAKPQRRRADALTGDMTYDQVKQRETEITFELGELKIRENELLQELIKLTEMLDKSQKN